MEDIDFAPNRPPPPTASSGSGAGSTSQTVEYTISEDRSEGKVAQVEGGYALLAKRGRSPVRPAPSGLQPFSFMSMDRSEHPNGSLQDYQMQLMLLEQQNRKRLCMAQREQCRTGKPAPADVLAPAPKTLTIQRHENYCVLYRVSCSSQRHQCDRKIYQDEPRQVQIRIRSEIHYENILEDHLGGDKPVADLRSFLSGLPKTAFVVYRDFHCSRGSTPSILGINSFGSARATLGREIVSVVSEDLQKALQESSLFSPDKHAYKGQAPDYNYILNPPPELFDVLSSSPSEYTHRFFYHHRQVLRQKAANTDGTTRESLQALVKYLDAKPDPMYAKCDDLFSRGAVTHETLPWLYAPNEVLVSTDAGSALQTAYVLRSVPTTEGSGCLRLSCWHWGYSGQRLLRRDETLSVQVSSFGETRIDQLSVYPLRFASQEVKDKLLANGKKFWEHRKPVQVAYQGPDYQHERSYPPDSRFMIDYQVYSKFHSSSPAFRFSTKERAAFDTWPESISGGETSSHLQLMLLPAGIHGFYFKEKKWMHLLVDNLRPVSWNKAAFEQLVLPKRTKSLVKALVMVRKGAWEEQPDEIAEAGLNANLKKDDIIAGKGNGLIMLLHGGPGTGKTLTAESVAELAEMPLYSVTCGDIGTKPEAVEMYLNSVLYLGKKWNCVLLLDEADVFLEQRTLSDLDRNSLVSVFLRTLEYYDGVLILTSNRVSTFDEAFKSRIQLALHYPALDVSGRRKIWNNFLDMLLDDTTPTQTASPPTIADTITNSSANIGGGSSSSTTIKEVGTDTAWEEKVNVRDIRSHMDELASYELNGRQIRNALTTARQLAVFERTVLDWEGLKDSIEVAGDFNRYVESMHGYDGPSAGNQDGAGSHHAVSSVGGRDRVPDEEGSWASMGTFR